MTRQECEKKILEKLEEIVDIYHEYHPSGRYLNLDYMSDEDGDFYGFNNRYWVFDDPDSEDGEDKDIPVKVWINKEVSA